MSEGKGRKYSYLLSDLTGFGERDFGIAEKGDNKTFPIQSGELISYIFGFGVNYVTGIFLPLPSVWNRKTCSDTQLLKVLMTVKDFCWRTILVSAEFRFLTLCNISGMEL